MHRDELAICRRRGHTRGSESGWYQCEWCKLWLRRVDTTEEQAEPPEDETDPSKYLSNAKSQTPSNPAELEICRRRGHSRPAAETWRKCDICGYWLRKTSVLEEQEDEPPDDDMSPMTRLLRMSKGMDRPR